jgi:hypothetical protein
MGLGSSKPEKTTTEKAKEVVKEVRARGLAGALREGWRHASCGQISNARALVDPMRGRDLGINGTST